MLNEDQWRGVCVTVIGDVMLDRYYHGTTSRVSPEAPVPIVEVSQDDERIGGAANVAANIVSLGARARLVGAIGHDVAGQTLERLCERHGIDARLLSGGVAQTTVKLRVLSQHQQLLRLDFENSPASINGPLLNERVLECLDDCDIVVFSDYGKGVLANIEELLALAVAAGKPTIVDPKSTNFARYRGASLVTPNFREFEACVGKCTSEEMIASRGAELCRNHNIGGLLITRGDQGMTLVSADGPPVTLQTNAQDVYDVTGAGDTVCAAIATALGAGESYSTAMQIANAAAGVVVGKLGTATVAFDELCAALGSREDLSAKLSREEVLEFVTACRARGETIVMTNGCFDILHAGHVAYLQEAKTLGSKLIVALNSDESVRRLKGAARPLNPLPDRAAVISALSAVDWVVSFDEDDPATLIESVGPDVLVKGGEYEVEQIAGADFVIQNGGRVTTIPMLEGRSTTALVESIVKSRKGSEYP